MPTNPKSAADLAPLLIGVAEVARLTGVCQRTIWALSASAAMPGPVSIGARRLWKYDAIQAWVAGGCQPVEGAR
jgi:predicted DNA-binding transcriptional regulator AlpA